MFKTKGKATYCRSRVKYKYNFKTDMLNLWYTKTALLPLVEFCH